LTSSQVSAGSRLARKKRGRTRECGLTDTVTWERYDIESRHSFGFEEWRKRRKGKREKEENESEFRLRSASNSYYL